MKATTILWFGPALLTLLLVLLSCSNDSPTGPGQPQPPPPDPNTLVTTISGLVSDEFGNPVVSGRVVVHGRTVSTGDNGEFFIPNHRVPKTRCFVTCSTAGYFTASRGETPIENGTTQFRIVLSSSATTHTLDATNGGIATFADGSTLQLPPAALVNADTTAYTSVVAVAARTFDASDAAFSLRISGGDLNALDNAPNPTRLRAFGGLLVELRASDGALLRLATGAHATVALAIPPSLAASAPAALSFWSLDESSALWTEAGTATRQGDRYVGDVAALGSLCAGIAAPDLATLCGRVVDPQSRPLSGLIACIDGWTAVTGADGRFCTLVEAGRTFPVRIEAALNLGIATPALSAGPIAAGSSRDVGDLVTDAVAHVTGTTRCGSSTSLSGVFVRFADGTGRGTVSGADGTFDAALPAGAGTLVAYSLSNGRAKQVEITAPLPGSTLDLGPLNFCTTIVLLINITSPRNNVSVAENVVNVMGTVSDQTITRGTLFVNGRSQTMAVSRGTFSSTAVFGPGTNTLRARVVNSQGTVASTQLSVRFQGAPIALTANLTWDTNATDIDLHMINPNMEECYYAALQIGGMKLDVDDRNGWGPENISVVGALSGAYQVRIHNYRNAVPTIVVARIFKGPAMIDEQTHTFDVTPVFWDVGTYTLP